MAFLEVQIASECRQIALTVRGEAAKGGCGKAKPSTKMRGCKGAQPLCPLQRTHRRWNAVVNSKAHYTND